MSTIGLRVRLERDRLGLGLEQLAEHCGVSAQAQQDIENDKAAPDAVYLGLAAQAGVDVVFVLTGQRREAAAGEQQLLTAYRAADEKERSALEAPAGAASAQPGVAAAAAQPAKNSGVALVVVIGLVVAAAVGVRACTARVDEQPHVRAAAPPGPSDTKPQAPPLAPYETTAAQLHRDYEANEVAADAKIDGRPLLVRGSLQAIDKDFLDAPVLALATSNQFAPVRLTLRREQASLAGQLKKGQAVAVHCMSVRRIIGMVVGADCDVRER